MRFRDRLARILTIKESPRRLATAFAFGVFIGMSPLIGLHTVLGLAVAWIFKLNRFVTLMGVFVTNPWTIVPIYTFSTWVGARLLGIHDIIPDIEWSTVSLSALLGQFRHLLLPFVAGSTFVGFVSAVIGYLVIYRTVRRTRG